MTEVSKYYWDQMESASKSLRLWNSLHYVQSKACFIMEKWRVTYVKFLRNKDIG